MFKIDLKGETNYLNSLLMLLLQIQRNDITIKFKFRVTLIFISWHVHPEDIF